VIAALVAFGFQFPDLSESDFTTPGHVVQLGVPPIRVDLLTEISGVTWEEAAAGAEAGIFGGISTRYLGREQFLRNKRSSGRLKDLADLEALGQEMPRDIERRNEEG